MRLGISISLALLFLFAAAAKVIYPLQLARVVVFLLPIPEWLTGQGGSAAAFVIVGAVVCSEVLLGLLLLQTRGRHAGILLGAAALVAVFTLALVVMLARGGAPSCGCFGTGTLFAGRQELAAGILRNLGMLCLLGWLLALCRENAEDRAPSTSAPTTRAMTSTTRGFTLVELLVCLAIIAVLLALAAPALRQAKTGAKSLGHTTTSAALMSSLAAYSTDHRESHPFFGVAGAPLAPVRVLGQAVPGEFFRAQRWFWASAVVPDYWGADRSAIEPPERASALQTGRGWPAGIVASDYQLTSTAFALPAFWRESAAQSWRQTTLARPTTRTMIRQPAQKGMIFHQLGGPSGQPPGSEMSVALADGSARTVNWKLLDPASAVARPWGAAGLPIESTRDGLAGSDFESRAATTSQQ